MPTQPAADFYRAQQRRIVATLGAVRHEWAAMSNDFDASWQTIGRRVAILTTAAQLGAARDGAAYVEAAVDVEADSAVIPRALAGLASDGRPLASLLDTAVITSKYGLANGMNTTQALERGGRWLDMAVHTQVADAGRDATSLAVTARPRVVWVRMVNPPCCQRCAVLAGKVYRFNQGFPRHPRCDCTHQVQEQGARPSRAATIGPDDVTDLTGAQRQAISDGHDFNKVVNDYQRGKAWHLPPSRVERITTATRDREAAVDSLRQAGYLAA